MGTLCSHECCHCCCCADFVIAVGSTVGANGTIDVDIGTTTIAAVGSTVIVVLAGTNVAVKRLLLNAGFAAICNCYRYSPTVDDIAVIACDCCSLCNDPSCCCYDSAVAILIALTYFAVCVVVLSYTKLHNWALVR